ncbi:MAG: hypothetical protein KAJ07_01030 [Planctomycetes bacterium]|nr:hypothetical protein [Planctomycetota bacterium]
MTARYVDNSKTDGVYDQMEASEEVTLVNGSPLITDVSAFLSYGQCIQLAYSTEKETYRIADTSPLSLDRAWGDTNGSFLMRYTDKNGESAANAKVNINEALYDAVAGDVVYVKHTSAGYLLSNADQIKETITPGAGSLLMKPIIIEGYKETIGDMRWGGAHYQSPLHAKVFGIDTTKKVTISGEDAIASLLTLDASDFVIIRNFCFKDATGLIIALANTPANVFFEHCVFADSGSVLNGVCNGFGFYDCYIEGMDYVVSSYTINCTGTIGAKFVGNVLDIGNYTKYGFSTGDPNLADVRGLYRQNLILKGAYPVLARAGDTITNNTVYDSPNCIRLGAYLASSTPATIQNNIIVPTAAADKAIHITGAGEGSIINDNNCFWTVAGVEVTNPIVNDVPGGGAVSIGPNSIEADPMMTSDYRPRNAAVLRGGKPDIYGNAGQIGAVLSEHKFVSNAVASNQGRMRIFR